MRLDRRSLLMSGSLTGIGAAALSGRSQFEAGNLSSNTGPKPKLAISSYSYWHFKKVKFPLEMAGCVDGYRQLPGGTLSET